MSRPLRIEYPGAWYHVMNRGTGRKSIFKTDQQRQYFLSLMADIDTRSKFFNLNVAVLYLAAITF